MSAIANGGILYGAEPKVETIVNGDVNIDIDTSLSTESTNPVQNKVITEAINGVIEDINTTTDSINGLTNTISDVDAKATEATNIAKGRNQAHVFATTSDMQTWLSNPDNAGLYNVGDNLYIVEVDVPDWWIAEVLTEADTDTGYYYKIGQLETQKVDLTNYVAKSDDVLLYRGAISGDDWATAQIGIWNTKVANETYGIPSWSTIHKTGNSSFTGSFLNCYASGTQRGIYAFDGTTNTFVKLPRQDEIDAIIDSITSVRNLKTYNFFENLGMTADNTLTEVFNAMPTGSQLEVIVPMGKSLSGTLPSGDTALLTVRKGNNERGTATWHRFSDNVVSENSCYGGVWQGWIKTANQSDLDTKVTNNFTAKRVAITDANGKIGVSGVTTTELGYLDGVTSKIQTQLDKKMPISGGETTGQMQFIRNLGVTNVSYSQAGVSMIAPTNESPESRAGIGFTNNGLNGAYLYLDTDGKLKFIDDQGVIKVITTTTQT